LGSRYVGLLPKKYFLIKNNFLVPFIFAYVSAYLFVGVPVLCVEMALGQFASVPPVELFRKMCPSLAGYFKNLKKKEFFKNFSLRNRHSYVSFINV